MRNRYDGAPGKESAIANKRQSRFEAEHSSKDQFVKKVEANQAKYAGKAPNMYPEEFRFDAYMCNNGEHAQELARSLTAGLDKTAFPVK